MKTAYDKNMEQGSSNIPAIQKEFSTGGKARIEDNRPSTVLQRKLQGTMNAHVADRTLPIQRRAPKGSSHFQEIATAMGKTHGVDTSGLVATHNSSFPAQLNAEATIQGNKIHFAPGMDSDYNIRHEVAHAIDNTLNGTPKGDKIVNGQMVDTTREKVVDRMANESVSIQRKAGNTNTQNEVHLSSSSRYIVQRKLRIRGHEVEKDKAWDLANVNDQQFEKPFKEGIFRSYYVANKSFASVKEFRERLDKILLYYSVLWNVNDSTASYIHNQIVVQHGIKDHLASYEGLLTTVGFEHEFASMIESPLKGVSHLELAKSKEVMPLTGIPFILETDASDSLELVSPPFLLPTVGARPLPHPEITGQVDMQIQKTLQSAIGKKIGVEIQSFSSLLDQLQYGLGVEFRLKNKTEIQAGNLSDRATVESLRGFAGNGKLTLKPRDIKAIVVGASAKVEAVRQDLLRQGKDVSHLDHGSFPQLNFATDVSTIALFENAENDKATNKKVIKFKKEEDHLASELKKPRRGSAKLDLFYTQMIRKLAGLYAVPAQGYLRFFQGKLFDYIMQGKNDDAELRRIKEYIYYFARYVSNVKDTEVIWVKDHIVSMAVALEAADRRRILSSLCRFLKGNSSFWRPRGEYREQYVRAVQKTIKFIIFDLKLADIREIKNSERIMEIKAEKPDIEGMYAHDLTKGGARQDTYPDPKAVQQPELWPGRRLHVAEIRHGNTEDRLDEAYIEGII